LNLEEKDPSRKKYEKGKKMVMRISFPATARLVLPDWGGKEGGPQEVGERGEGGRSGGGS